jgi:S1-C subfamily serine protease
LNFDGEVVKSCIHCHQIGDAQRHHYRSRSQPIPEDVLFPYPHPKSVGLTLDPKERATVLRVEPGTPASTAGLAAGDEILALAGQPLLSIADVQWVLHTTSAAGGELVADVKRANTSVQLRLRLPASWRRAGDLAWRSTSWGLRRMAAGGLVLEEVSPADRRTNGLEESAMALRVKHVGQYGPYSAAKQAGFRVGDVLLEYDGRKDLTRETDLLAHGLTRRKLGDRVSVTIMRDGNKIVLSLSMQE